MIWSSQLEINIEVKKCDIFSVFDLKRKTNINKIAIFGKFTLKFGLGR